MVNNNLFPERPSQLPIEISQKATEWYVRLQADDVSADDFTEFEQWLKQDQRHQQAWQCLEDFGLSLEKVKHPLLQPALAAIEKQDQIEHHLFTPKSLIWLLVFGGSVLGLYTAQQQQLWQQWQADYKTKTGEQRRLDLADGSHIILNTDTAINVTYDQQQRHIELIKGEIHIEVVQDTQKRPFYVQNRDGLMQDIGTTFNIRQYDQHSVLSVSEGEVQITTQKSKQVAHVLANKQVLFSKTAIQPIVDAQPQYSTWTKGILNVYKMPLTEFLTELDRYHSGKLYYDYRIADLEVSGVFPMQDSEKVLKTLEQGLPIKVESQFYYWTKVSLKEE